MASSDDGFAWDDGDGDDSLAWGEEDGHDRPPWNDDADNSSPWDEEDGDGGSSWSSWAPEGDRPSGEDYLAGEDCFESDRLSGDRHSSDEDWPSDSGLSVASEIQSDSTLQQRDGSACKRRRVSETLKVTGLATCFSWAILLWSTLARLLGDRLLYHRLCCRRNNVGSYFSGLGTLEVALGMVAAVAPSAIRARCWFEFAYACEKSWSLRQLLCQRTSCCVFENLLDRLSGLLDNCSVDSLGFEGLRDVMLGASVVDVAQCARHDGSCKYPGRVALDVSGSPCRPWSRALSAGNRGRQHKDIVLFLAWCVIMRQTRPFVAIHENVLGFDKSLLLELLNDLYDIIVLRAAPSHAGFAFIRRPRYYFVLTLRGVATAGNLQELYDEVSSQFTYDISEWPSWVWRASQNELLEEENRARQSARLEPLATPSSDWSYLLSDKQRGVLKQAETSWANKYSRAAHEDPMCVLDISQSSARLHLGRGVLPTLRTHSERIWSSARKRWLTVKERLACMGYPVYEDLAAAARVPLDTISPTGPRFSPGNAMHVANLGIIVMVVLAGCDFP